MERTREYLSGSGLVEAPVETVPSLPTGVGTFLLSDVEGSTRLGQDHRLRRAGGPVPRGEDRGRCRAPGRKGQRGRERRAHRPRRRHAARSAHREAPNHVRPAQCGGAVLGRPRGAGRGPRQRRERGLRRRPADRAREQGRRALRRPVTSAETVGEGFVALDSEYAKRTSVVLVRPDGQRTTIVAVPNLDAAERLAASRDGLTEHGDWPDVADEWGGRFTSVGEAAVVYGNGSRLTATPRTGTPLVADSLRLGAAAHLVALPGAEFGAGEAPPEPSDAPVRRGHGRGRAGPVVLGHRASHRARRRRRGRRHRRRDRRGTPSQPLNVTTCTTCTSEGCR